MKYILIYILANGVTGTAEFNTESACEGTFKFLGEASEMIAKDHTAIMGCFEKGPELTTQMATDAQDAAKMFLDNVLKKANE